tara:strand:+ start:1862 stop:2107 length:246 start_codon:yes stop_codon:yes gene_type:complete
VQTPLLEFTLHTRQLSKPSALQCPTDTNLIPTQVEALRVQISEQLQQRADVMAALSSSRAFLSRGFRDIEMLLEASFTDID